MARLSDRSSQVDPTTWSTVFAPAGQNCSNAPVCHQLTAEAGGLLHRIAIWSARGPCRGCACARVALAWKPTRRVGVAEGRNEPRPTVGSAIARRTPSSREMSLKTRIRALWTDHLV